MLGGKDDIWTRLKSPAAWGIAVGKVMILMSRESINLRSGKITPDQFRVRTGGHFGSSAGIILGAAAGAAAGSLVPGIGNIAGAFAGGVIGAMSGEEIGRLTAKYLAPNIVKDEPSPEKAAKSEAPPDETKK